jgi:hypothetical protein
MTDWIDNLNLQFKSASEWLDLTAKKVIVAKEAAEKTLIKLTGDVKDGLQKASDQIEVPEKTHTAVDMAIYLNRDFLVYGGVIIAVGIFVYMTRGKK